MEQEGEVDLERITKVSSLEEFWNLVLDVWNHGVFGIDFGRIAIAILIFCLFMLFRRIFTKLIMQRIEAGVGRTNTKLDDSVVQALREPIQFIPVVLGAFIAFEYLDLEGGLADIAENITRSLIIFLIFWGFYRVVDPLRFVLHRVERVFTEAMVSWLLKALKALIAFLGLATILEVWGIEIGPILAGLGLFGVAVALGAQDLFKNLIAGILILVERRFSIGDWIRVDGIVEGIVESIGFRSTFIRQFDKAPVYVPNTQLSDSAVTNFSRMTNRRIYWVIGVEYRTTVDQLKQIRDRIEGYVLTNEAFEDPAKVSTFVRIDKFNDSSIDIMLYCFTKTTNWGEWLAIKEELAYQVKRIVEEAGTGFAFPSRSIYVETVPGADTPEVFTPPRTESGPQQKAIAKKPAAKKTRKKIAAKKTAAKKTARRKAAPAKSGGKSKRGPSEEARDGGEGVNGGS